MKRNKIASVSFYLIGILFLISCSKIETTDLGSDLIPAVDNVHTFETTLDIVTENLLFNDSTRMLDGEDHGVGIIENDPEFGKSSLATYASFSPAAFKSYPFVKKDSVIIDSIVLSLAYKSAYGDSTSKQTFEVHEIDNRFKKFEDSLYLLTAPDFDLKSDLLGSRVVSFDSLNDSTFYKNAKDVVRQNGELRIKLDTSWGRRFVNYDTTNAYNNDTVFQEKYFAGLQVRSSDASTVKNAIAYFDLTDNNRTRITFYCRVQNNGHTDTIAPFFAYYSGPHANIVRRTPMNGYQSNMANTVPNDEKLYIQSSPGSYVTIKIPDLEKFADTNRVINRAELIFEKYPSHDGFYSPPRALFIDALSDNGDSAYTIRNDYVRVSNAPGYDLNAIGGTFRNNQYVFNISRYIQSIVTKKFPSYTLRVYAPFTTQLYFIPEYSAVPSGKIGVILNTPVASGRVVLYGAGTTDPKKARLRIIYSSI